MFVPTTTPKPQADVDRVLDRLAAPFRLRLDDKDINTPEHVAATVAAAAAGIAPAPRLGAAVAPPHGGHVGGTPPGGHGAPAGIILPPPEVLRAFRARTSKRPVDAGRAGGAASSDDEADPLAEDARRAVDADLGLGRPGPRRGRKPK